VPLTDIALVLLTGVVSGFVNIVGGGGSLISMPVLIFLGLPSAVANGTNRVALMVQSLVAIGYFRQKGFFYPKLSLMLGIPALVGSSAGARLAAAALVFFGVGFYGGFIQAGVGFIIIAALALITGMSLVKINSLKVLITLIYMSTSLLVFVLSGKVDWLLGFVLAAGNAAGAYLGSAFSVHKGDRWIRAFLVVSVTLMAAKLLNVHKLLGF